MGKSSVEQASEREKCDDMPHVGVGTSNEAAEPIVQHNEEAKKIHDLMKDVEQELYPGCRKFSKLSFIVRLLQLKHEHEWDNDSFNMLVGLLKGALPKGETLPESFFEMEKIMKDLGIADSIVHARPNDASTHEASPIQHPGPTSSDAELPSSQGDSNRPKEPMKPITLRTSSLKKKKAKAR